MEADLDLAGVHEDAVLHKVTWFLPRSLQPPQVEEVGGAVFQLEAEPRASVVT